LHLSQFNAIITKHREYPLFASPRLNEGTKDQNEMTLLDWLEERLGFTEEQSKKLAQRQPSILNASIRDQLESNIAWLEKRLHLKDDQASLRKVVLRLTPMAGGLVQLLGFDMEETLEPNLVWLQEKLNLRDDGIVQLVKKESSFLGLSLESHKERVSWLQKRLALDDGSLSKLVQTLPSVLCMSVENNLEPKLSWLQERLALDDGSLSKLVKTFPTVLGMSVEDNLEPKLSWLQERLDMDAKSLSKLVKTVPSVLGLSVENNLSPKLFWLKDRLDMDDKRLSKLVKRLPQVFSCSIKENLEPTLAWLQARLKLDDKGLSSVIQRMPTLLGCNIDTNLEPSVNFYEDCVGSTAAIRFIVNNPAVLGYSLEKRLKPRLAAAQEAGIPINTGTLSRIAMITAENWSISMDFQEDKLLKAKLREDCIANLENKPLKAQLRETYKEVLKAQRRENWL
jgi:ferric-dicitrate binding protein FerR (iron transport regulator)